MAVITLAQYKTIQGVTSTDATRDARISAMIPQVEDDIIAICNNKFLNKNVYFQGDITPDETGGAYSFGCADGGISDSDFTAGDVIYTASFVRNNGRYTTTVIADTKITVSEEVVDEDEVSGATFYLVQWPVGVRLYAAQMLSYLLKHADDAGLQSENIKSYSYSRSSDALQAGYPSIIVQGLKRGWGLVGTGFGSRRSHYDDKRGTWVGESI